MLIGTTPTSSQTIPPARDESMDRLLKFILEAKHNEATEITVSPAPETSIMFLLNPQNSYMTGSVIYCDGGWTAK